MKIVKKDFYSLHRLCIIEKNHYSFNDIFISVRRIHNFYYHSRITCDIIDSELNEVTAPLGGRKCN